MPNPATGLRIDDYHDPGTVAQGVYIITLKFSIWHWLCTEPVQDAGIPNAKPPSFRRKPESRKSPGKERAGYREFWIPAFAGTTVAWNDGGLGCPIALVMTRLP